MLTLSAPERRKANAGPPTFHEEMAAVDAAVADVIRAGAASLNRAARHYRGPEVWGIGTIPEVGGTMDQAEARIKRVLTGSALATSQVSKVTARLKVVSDLRTAIRSARQVVQIAWLLRQLNAPTVVFTAIQAVGEAACAVAEETRAALEQGDEGRAYKAALLFRAVEEARAAGEQAVGQISSSDDLTVQRLMRSAIWFMAIAGECFARVAARLYQDAP